MLTCKGYRVFLIASPTDMRKSFNGLAGLASLPLGATPVSRDPYLFCNRKHNRLKVLLYDESGTWVLAKRLDKGTFAWPAVEFGVNTVVYRKERLTLLLGGFDTPTPNPRLWCRRAG